MRGWILAIDQGDHTFRSSFQPEVEFRANLKSFSHRCHPILVAFVWELTKETIHLPLGYLQGGVEGASASGAVEISPPLLTDHTGSNLRSHTRVVLGS